jgi:hypothetical protein
MSDIEKSIEEKNVDLVNSFYETAYLLNEAAKSIQPYNGLLSNTFIGIAKLLLDEIIQNVDSNKETNRNLTVGLTPKAKAIREELNDLLKGK